MLSSFATLKETFYIGRRNFWYLATLALIFLPPDVLFTLLHHDARAGDSFWSGACRFAASSAHLVLDSAQVAALFGLLNRRPIESAWTAAWRGTVTYTLTMLWLLLLICCGAIPLAGLGAVLVHLFGPKAEMFTHTGFIFFFLLSAPAFPLVAQENLGSVAALKRGLGMTKRHFLFVVGCCLIPSLGEWLIRWLISAPIDTGNDEISWSRTLNAVVSGLIGSAWGILFWSICRRIRAAELPSSNQPDSDYAAGGLPSGLDSRLG
jgi:hypothetical protein